MECTVKELCEMYNITRTTSERWRKQGLPFKIIGTRLIRFDIEEVEKWVNENKFKEVKHNYREKPVN